MNMKYDATPRDFITETYIRKKSYNRCHKKFMLVSQCFNSIEINNTSTGEQITKKGSLLYSKTEHTCSFTLTLDYVGVHSEAAHST